LTPTVLKMARIDFHNSDIETLAEPLELMRTPEKTVIAPNRIVYQPMEGNDALEDGGPGEVTISRYIKRAEGHAGIDFFEAVAVSPSARARENQLVINESTRSGFESLIKKYRERNQATPILFQLTHSGMFALKPVSPYSPQNRDASLLTDADMEKIQQDFVNAARIAYECGADGIDFKHCHGYLCGSMLGSANIKRSEWRWGGDTIGERSVFFARTLKMMMEAVSPDRFLYTLRLSAFEGLPGGFGARNAETVETAETAEEDGSYKELKAFCRIAEENGIRLINQSAGVPDMTPHLVRPTDENPGVFFDHQKYAAIIKETVGIPVIGSAYSYLRDGRNNLPGEDPVVRNIVSLGSRAVRENKVDFIGIGRQSMADPHFAVKLFSKRWDEINWDLACNKCAVSLRAGIHAGCAVYDPYYKNLQKQENGRD